MDQKSFFSPPEIPAFCSASAIKKGAIPATKVFVLSIIAGAFIGFAAFGSNMGAHNLLADPTLYGLGRCLAGMLFSVGLMLVVVGGGELFTGNTLLYVAVLEKKLTYRRMLQNWLIVWVGNLIGSLFIAVLVVNTPLFHASNELLAAVTIKIAAGKTSLSFFPALALGILCNWLVCMGVWMSFAAKDIAGKLLACFFPIWLFVCSGFEHSVANMTYIPMGLLAKSTPEWLSAAQSLGVSADALARLTWGNMLISNLLPVTIGNIIGGAGFVGLLYWYSYQKDPPDQG